MVWFRWFSLFQGARIFSSERSLIFRGVWLCSLKTFPKSWETQPFVSCRCWSSASPPPSPEPFASTELTDHFFLRKRLNNLLKQRVPTRPCRNLVVVLFFKDVFSQGSIMPWDWYIYIYIFLLFLKTKNYRNYNQVGKSRYIYHSRGLFVCFLFLGSKLDTAWRERERVC